MIGRINLTCGLWTAIGAIAAAGACGAAAERTVEQNAVYAFERQQVEQAGRQKMTKMPTWLKEQRDAYRDRLAAAAQKSYQETGIWFLSRGASRITDEQETYAVWGDLLFMYGGDLKKLPSYSETNHRQAIAFWRSWQNLRTGQLYNPLYQDPQNPEAKRTTPGNRPAGCPGLNPQYVSSILGKLGATLATPVNIQNARPEVDTFDRLWGYLPQWANSPAGMFPIAAARELDGGNLDKIPQVEAGMAALVRAYSRETGMWRPEPLKGFPWGSYQPSSGFKIIARICGYVGTENFPKDVLETAINNLVAHKGELHSSYDTARNYGEMMGHFVTMTDYRRDELLDAMEECLNGFRDPNLWRDMGSGVYCIFGSGMIGAFMNWEDLPFGEAMSEPGRFNHGCAMKWRFVACPYGNWVNVIPKEPQAILGHPGYDVGKYGLKARNKVHWAKKITEVIPQQDVELKLAATGPSGEGTFTFTLTQDQLAGLKGPYLKATWSGAYDVSLNGEPVKQVRYNLPNVPAGWYVPAPAAKTLRVGQNTVTVKRVGPGKDPKPGAPLSVAKPFIRLGLIDWQ